MSQYAEKIDKIRDELEKAKDAKIRTEARLEQLQKQKDEIYEELRNLGIDPGNIESEIGILRAEIEQALEKLSQLLPKNMRE